jgi:leucine dehydrogenase
MSVFASPDFDEHEEVIFVNDQAVGLRGIIAIHSTVLGPALGGCRMYPYANEAEAIKDVLRLSRGMTYKAAIAGVKLGGGKSVIIGDSHRDKTDRLLQAVGRAIERLQARYIVGEDIGTTPLDMKVMRSVTRAVSCLPAEDGGYGDPAPMTALGVFQAIRAGLQHRHGSDCLRGLKVAVQGVGNVGRNLCRLLAEAGAQLWVCDTYAPNAESARRAFGAVVVAPQAIYALHADVFAPCAVGGTLNDLTIPQLKAGIVAGAANNQLAEQRHAEALKDRGIVYVPDYVANGGGLISCAAEWYRTDPQRIPVDVNKIYDTCLAILEDAARSGSASAAAADRLARKRIETVKKRVVEWQEDSRKSSLPQSQHPCNE